MTFPLVQAGRGAVTKILAMVCLATLLLAEACFFPTRALAETRALVVGINDYAYIRQLRGAVNDARDIESVLRKRGVRDLTVLIDREATRARLLGELDRLVGRVGPGDLVIVTFAGHGDSEIWGREHPRDAREGEKHEVFLLRDVAIPDSSGRVPSEWSSGAGERIAGRELQQRFIALEGKGARTIFVADTCHGGGLARAPDFSASEQSYRVVPAHRGFLPGQDPLAPIWAALPAAVDPLKGMPSLTLLAAVDSNNTAPEVRIPAGSTTSRGALSYAFARVLEGELDNGRDGLLLRKALYQFIRVTVKQYTQNAQIPDLQPSPDAQLGPAAPGYLIDFSRDLGIVPSNMASNGTTVVQPSPAEQAVSRTVSFYVDAGDSGPDIASRGRSGDLDVRRVASRQDADFILDLTNRKVVSQQGDVVVFQAARGVIDGIAEREVARRELLELARPRSWDMHIDKGDAVHHSGELLKVDARSSDAHDTQDYYYVLFNIAGDGTIQYIYPRAEQNDRPILPSERPLLDLDARAPFGTDTLVIVTSPRPLDGLVGGLRALHDRIEPRAAVRLIRTQLAAGIRIGVQQVFTAP